MDLKVLRTLHIIQIKNKDKVILIVDNVIQHDMKTMMKAQAQLMERMMETMHRNEAKMDIEETNKENKGTKQTKDNKEKRQPQTEMDNLDQLEEELGSNDIERNEIDLTMLETPDGDPRAIALSAASIEDVDPETGAHLNTGRIKITRMQQLVELFKKKETEILTKIKAAFGKDGIAFAHEISEILKSLRSDYGFNAGLSSAFLWTCLSDETISEDTSSAEAALQSFFRTKRRDVKKLFDTCSKGEAGIDDDYNLESIDYTVTPGYQWLQESEGWRVLLLATVKQMSANHSTTEMIQEEIKKFKGMKQGADTAATFIGDLEQQLRYISKMCRMAGTDRTPKRTDWMDQLEQGAAPEVVEAALYELTVLQNKSRDEFTYALMKAAVLKAERALRDQNKTAQARIRITRGCPVRSAHPDDLAHYRSQTKNPFLKRVQNNITAEDHEKQHHALMSKGLCVNHVAGKCTKEDCMYKHEALEDHGLKSEDFQDFFVDPEFLKTFKKMSTLPLPADPPQENDEKQSGKRTYACVARAIPYNPKVLASGLYDSDTDDDVVFPKDF